LEKKLYCTCVFLDVSQEFDRVWYDGLLFKFKSFLPHPLFLLIKSYLTDRHIQVHYRSAYSEITKINAGVPQGGILSPTLFNIYVSDQPTTPQTMVADYADDKVILSISEIPVYNLIKPTTTPQHNDELVRQMEYQNKPEQIKSRNIYPQ